MSAPDPSRLRKVICEICGDETGEVATDPVGTCAGCATVMRYSSLDGEPAEPQDDDHEQDDDYEPDDEL